MGCKPSLAIIRTLRNGGRPKAGAPTGYAAADEPKASSGAAVEMAFKRGSGGAPITGGT